MFGLNLVWPRFVVRHVTVGGAEGYANSVRLVMYIKNGCYLYLRGIESKTTNEQELEVG